MTIGVVMSNEVLIDAVKKYMVNPTKKEMSFAHKKICRYYSLIRKQAMTEKSLPELVKTLSMQPCSSRFISRLFYSKSSNNCENQYAGRELKRWAAHELSELFEEKAIVQGHWMKALNGEYWHE
jgi:hypothetical protein